MFTGIVKGLGKIVAIERLSGLCRLAVLLPPGAESDVELGASIAVNGVCLSVVKIDSSIAHFDIMAETLVRTNLGTLELGSLVNVERAARDGAEVGGHAISGHIDCMARIVKIEKPENNHVLTFEVPSPFERYIFSKGYVALNGTSLTISGVVKAERTFQVWLIPETLRLTTFGLLEVGDTVNLEVERGTLVTVDTIRDFLEERLAGLLPDLSAQVEAYLGGQGKKALS